MPCQTDKDWSIAAVIIVILLGQSLGYRIVYLLIIFLFWHERPFGLRTGTRRLRLRGVPFPLMILNVVNGRGRQPDRRAKRKSVEPNLGGLTPGTGSVAAARGCLEVLAWKDVVSGTGGCKSKIRCCRPVISGKAGGNTS